MRHICSQRVFHMTRFIEARCPSCGADLEISAGLDTACCTHCGGSFIIAGDEVSIKESTDKKKCPLCAGKGITRCMGIENITVTRRFRSYDLYVEACSGDGKCLVYCSPSKIKEITNYCRGGKCAWCRGTGRLLFGTCSFCEGTGSCRFCHGTGVCTFCNGKGVVRCRRCDGRGTKV